MNLDHLNWLYLPTAVLLGALHGMEPGHSKTMMAAFIIAVRGTVWQALLLGLSAAVSHSLLIWVLAATALHYGQQMDVENLEPYIQLGSAVIILGMAAWMYWRTRSDLLDFHQHHHHHHHHGHDHDHPHDHDHNHHDDHSHHGHEDGFELDTGDGRVRLSVFEDGVPPVFHLHPVDGTALPQAHAVTVQTLRPDGSEQTFAFTAQDGCLESTETIPEPHEFKAILRLRHGDHDHTCTVEFREHGGPALSEAEYQDAHEREHAEQIVSHFAGRTVTTPQIVLFGITGGLMPCPAAFTILLVCLQLKRVALGFAMVAAFSFGLALTMVTTGVVVALTAQHASKRFRGFGNLARRAPYASVVLLVVLAGYMAWHGWHGLHS